MEPLLMLSVCCLMSTNLYQKA